MNPDIVSCCLLYTSDAADERSSVDLGGRRIIKKKKTVNYKRLEYSQNTIQTMYINHRITKKQNKQKVTRSV